MEGKVSRFMLAYLAGIPRMTADLPWIFTLFRPSCKTERGADGYRHLGQPERCSTG